MRTALPSVFFEKFRGALPIYQRGWNQMKRLKAFLLTGMLLLTGCTPAQEESTESEPITVYKALPLPDLYMEIPERFATTSSELYEEYYICEDASIICTEDTEDAPYGSVYDYAISALTEYQKITTTLELMGNELLYADNLAVQTLEFRYSIGEGEDALKMTCMVGYVTDTESMYIITCKSKQDTYDEYRADFESVLTSLSFVK